MFYEIEIPEIVYNDIYQLSDYIFRFSFSKEISRKIYDELYKAIFSLDFMPNRYSKYLGEYRKIIVKGNYKIIYKVLEKEKKVIIIRVIRTERVNFEV